MKHISTAGKMFNSFPLITSKLGFQYSECGSSLTHLQSTLAHLKSSLALFCDNSLGKIIMFYHFFYLFRVVFEIPLNICVLQSIFLPNPIHPKVSMYSAHLTPPFCHDIPKPCLNISIISFIGHWLDSHMFIIS